LLRENIIIRAVLVFLLVSGAAFSQFQVRNFYTLVGKRESPVNVINQNTDGRLLLGTPDGVYRFDGRTSIEISPRFRKLNQNVTAIYRDSHNRKWLGTVSGKIYILTKHDLDSVILPEENTDRITSFYETGSQIIVSTYGNGLYIIEGTKISHCTTENGLSDNTVYTLTGEGNTIWCATDAGLTRIELKGKERAFTAISDHHGLPDNIVRNVHIYGKKLLISMQDSGVCYYNLATRAFERIRWFNHWSKGAVLNACVIENKLVVATEMEGIFVYDEGTTSQISYQSELHVPSISQMFIDREKQIWVASKKGLSQIKERRYFLIDSSYGLKNNKILAVAADANNAVWVGTPAGINHAYKDSANHFSVKTVKELSDFNLSCASLAPDGNIWFGTFGNGLIILDTMSTRRVVIKTDEDKLANDNISHIYFADVNTVYISTLGGGLSKVKITYRGRIRTFQNEKVFTQKQGLGSDYVYASVTDKKNRLFVGTDGGGLQMYEEGRFVNIGERFGRKFNTVFSLCRDDHGHIWATTNNDGIVRYDGKSLKSFGYEDGLRDLEPQQLVSFNNAIYAMHTRGIDRIDCATGDVTYHDFGDIELEPNLNAAFVNGDNIYSGTNHGLLVFKMASKSELIKPTVFISSLEVNNKEVSPDSVNEFRHNLNHFTFTFDGVWLRNPERLTFRYKLDGLESEWKYSDDGMSVNYNNLLPGKYMFIVQSRNEEDVFSEQVGYSFVILTPFWKHWWFWVLVITIVVTGTYTLIDYRLKQLQRKNELLEEKVQMRTREIAAQSKIIENKNQELEQLSLVASKTDNVVLILDPDGNLEYVNESFQRVTGLSLAEIKRKYGNTIYEFSNHPSIREIINDAVNNRKSVTYESLNRKVETREVWDSSTLTPIFDEYDRLKKIIIIDTDVSERKRNEQIITQKNKDITDSISYARKIQHAILPSTAQIKEHLPESFVLYMTKDIVSGDFFWFTHMYDFSIIAAVDCTGHGVPGAFMSLIGYNVLNRVINENKIFDPSRILLELNEGVLSILHKNESESKDGMDIAICKINHSSHTVQYAGAMRPFWIVNNGHLTEIKADKIPIGTKHKDRDDPIAYTTHTIPVKTGDKFYIFTDGYADQFGGKKDKKYSTGRFKELVTGNAHLKFEEQLEIIKQEHINWRGENEQVDDILVIGFEVRPAKLIG
jgi:PAS domain S-box-containing protein